MRALLLAVTLVTLVTGCVSNEKMIEAAAAGRTSDVIEALDQGGDVAFRSRAPGANGDTALSAAARNGHLNTVEALFRKGVKPLDQPEAIIAASGGGHASVVRALLDHGASPNAVLPAAQPGGELRTPLGMASLHGKGKVARLLLGSKAEARASSSVALRQAIRGGHTDLAELLISKGAKPKESGPDRRTTLHLASGLRDGEPRGTNRAALIRLLHKKGVPVDAADAQGDTALMLAVRSEAFRHVEVLVELGADPKKKVEGAGTPAQWADKHSAQSPEMAKIARMLGKK
jgi:ankyrin repeat protein